MATVSATQSEVASGALLLLGSATGVGGTTHIGFAAAAGTVVQVNKLFASGGIPLLATFTTGGVVYPCFSTAQLAKMLLLPHAAAGSAAAVPALTQCADGAPATALAACALATVSTYRFLLFA
jgi:hypothetical protein